MKVSIKELCSSNTSGDVQLLFPSAHPTILIAITACRGRVNAKFEGKSQTEGCILSFERLFKRLFYSRIWKSIKTSSTKNIRAENLKTYML